MDDSPPTNVAYGVYIPPPSMVPEPYTSLADWAKDVLSDKSNKVDEIIRWASAQYLKLFQILCNKMSYTRVRAGLAADQEEC